MSLLYWLPMLGSLENQGLSNAQPVNHGATVNTAGKLGSCYDFSGTQQYIDTGYKEELGSGDFSIAAWFKLTDSGSRTYQPIISNKNTTAISVGCAIYYNHSQQKFLWSTADGSSATEVWMLNQYPYATMLNTWHHIVMVRNSSDAKKGYFYIDGVRYELSSVPAIRNVTNTTYNMMIGDICNHASSSYSWTGSICDLRIYDNAISAREAKELSKGLCLHYPLSREGFGCDNLLYGNYSCVTTSSSNTEVGSADLPNISNIIFNNQGKTLWLSFDYSCEGARNNNTGRHSSLGNRYGVHLSFRYTKTDGTQAQHYPCANYLTMSGTGKAVMSYIIPTDISSVDNFGISTQPYAGPADGNNATWYLRNLKLEIGDKATPWIPHQENWLYYDMGLNIGNENLLTKSAINPANWQHTFPNVTSYTGDGYDNLFTMVTTSSFEHVYIPVTVTANQQYTFSVTYQVLDSFELWQSYRPFSFQVLSAAPTNADTYNNVIGSILIGNTAMASPQRGSTTFTPTGTTIWLNIPGAYYKDGSTSYNKRVKFSRLKLETGSIATQWVSATTDPGYEKKYAIDVSGYHNNGSINYPYLIESSSNTPKYSTSTIFKRLSSSSSSMAHIETQNFYMPDVFTISYWWYFDSDLKLINNPPSSFGYGTYAGYNVDGVHDYDNKYIVNFAPFESDTVEFSKSISHISHTLLDKTWSFQTITFDGYNMKYYYNGELTNSVATGKANAYHVVRSAKVLFIGLDRAGGVFRGVSGNISDFRIYATVLTDDDILSLYNTPMTLANNGTLLTQGEFSEV